MRTSNRLIIFFVGFLICLALTVSTISADVDLSRVPSSVLEGVVSTNLTLSGEVTVKKDVFVPPGVTLEFLEGTKIKFVDSESTKVEPENMMAGTEITVMGKLVARGCKFEFPGNGGIAVNGGKVDLRRSTIEGARIGVLLLSGELKGGGMKLARSEYGLVVGPDASIDVDGNVFFSGCEVSLVATKRLLDEVRDRVRGDGLRFVLTTDASIRSFPKELSSDFSPVKVYEDLFVNEDLTLSGDILVKGVIRVAPGVHLKIEPGTRVLFEFRDTNGDGIGENGIFLQGTLLAVGEKDKPIYFGPYGRSMAGSWDAVNFTVSDSEKNVLKNVIVAGAYRGIHSHFSDVSMENVRVLKSFRGIQFQESTVSLKNVVVEGVVSGVRCRDSDVSVERLSISAFLNGLHMLRVRGKLRRVTVKAPLLFGIRMRECDVVGEDFNVSGGLFGLSLQDMKGQFYGLRQSGSAVTGLLAQYSSIDISRSSFSRNGRYGLSFKGGKYGLVDVEIIGFGEAAINVEESPVIDKRNVVVGKSER